MKSKSQQLLGKSARAIAAASALLERKDFDFAASRAYYAMFYAAEALLFEKGWIFSKHGGVHAAFGEHFIKTGILDAKFHRWLLDAFDKRIQSDYGIDAVITPEQIQELIQ